MKTVPNTNRQFVTTSDGTALQRSYIYLSADVWAKLHEAARVTGTSVSKVITTFALNGIDSSKEKNDQASPSTK